MAAPYDNWLIELQSAIDAVIASLASGKATVEYEIRGRRHRVAPSQQLLESLLKSYASVEALAARRNHSVFAPVRLTRPSSSG